MLNIEGLSKAFGKTKALRDVTFSIERGQIFGLLGPNAAGKTTLIRCLLKIIYPSSGRIVYEGEPLREEVVHKHFGFLPENFSPYRNLTAWELLNILSRGINSTTEELNSLIKDAGLSSHIHKRLHTYSRGLIQRLGLALSLLGGKSFLVLDEPTLGLDPLGQRQILEMLKNLRHEGKTIFFSSHILSQVERVCDKVGIINQGRLIFCGGISEFLLRNKSSTLEDAFLSEVDRDF